jgi:hypothetical protein
MRAFGKFIARMRGDSRPNSSYQQQRQRQRQNPPKKTETQEDRIIDYQKKSFEATQVEDVDFEEIRK